MNPYTRVSPSEYHDPFTFRKDPAVDKKATQPKRKWNVCPAFIHEYADIICEDFTGLKSKATIIKEQARHNAELKARFEDLAYGRR